MRFYRKNSCTNSFAVLSLHSLNMVVVAQLVRASVCGTECRGFDPRLPPHFKVSSKRKNNLVLPFFFLIIISFLSIILVIRHGFVNLHSSLSTSLS